MKNIREILDELEPTSAVKEREMKDQLESLIDQMYSSGILYSEAVREFRKKFILRVLREHRGNQCKAARELGMHRNTLARTIAELKLDIREMRDGLARNPRYTPRPKPVQPAAMATTAGAKQA